MNHHSLGRQEVTEKLHRYRFLEKIRPNVLANPLYSLVFPFRTIIEHEGLRLNIDPVSHLGRSLLLKDSYEPQTFTLFRDIISAGDTVLDVGANEGIFSALAASLVGPTGCVIAVEPQSRMQDTLEINLALNAKCQTLIARNAVDEIDGRRVEIELFPRSCTGASSLVHRYRWGRRTQIVETITPSTLLRQAERPYFDLVKIDVEGYEPEVVRSLPMDRVKNLLVDYHASILIDRGLDPGETDAFVRRTHRLVQGSIAGGYVLYRSIA